MSGETFQTCPACGTPVAAEAAFCDNCGAELSPASGSSPSPASSVLLTPPPPAAPSPEAAGPAPETEEALPFVLEWDERREFIEGVGGNFALRLRALRRIVRLQLSVRPGDAPAETLTFRNLKEGDWREEMIGWVPKAAGALAVRVSALVCSEGGSREGFEACRPFEHCVNPFRRFLPVGSQNILIDNRDNNGIIRLDNLRIPPQGMEDLRKEIGETLGKRGGWRTVPFGAGAVLRECVRLRSPNRELLVVAGSDLVTFGMHSSRPVVLLSAESPDGIADARRERLVSRIHFSVCRDRRRQVFLLRDGGPSKENPACWTHSTNRTELDGCDASEQRLLPENRTLDLDVAPRTVSGKPALCLSVETRGWDDPAAGGCVCVGNLSSLLLRYRDNPRKAVLVVWGGADLGGVLGTGRETLVRMIRGRLHLVRSGERPVRLLDFEGRRLPGTPCLVF